MAEERLTRLPSARSEWQKWNHLRYKTHQTTTMMRMMMLMVGQWPSHLCTRRRFSGVLPVVLDRFVYRATSGQNFVRSSNTRAALISRGDAAMPMFALVLSVSTRRETTIICGPRVRSMHKAVKDCSRWRVFPSTAFCLHSAFYHRLPKNGPLNAEESFLVCARARTRSSLSTLERLAASTQQTGTPSASTVFFQHVPFTVW